MSTPADALPAATPPVDDAGWQALPPAAARVSAFVGALTGLPFAAGATVLSLVRLDSSLPVAGGVALLALALFGGAGAWLAHKRCRRTRWRLDARGLQVRRGLVWQGEVLVPRSRVQHLDLERGPIERRYGLATLVMHTAGTRLYALRQSGFADADAVALRDALLPEAEAHDDDAF